MSTSKNKLQNYRKKVLALVVLVIAVAFFVPRYWFSHLPQSQEAGLWLESSPAVQGYSYQEEEITAEVQALLATTNLASGTFRNLHDGSRIRIFTAKWIPSQGRGRTLVNHTPDVCWVNAGWSPIDDGHAEPHIMSISRRDVPFERRVFEAPNQKREMTVWCTIVNGEPLVEPFRLNRKYRGSGVWVATQNLTRLAIGRFLDRIKTRTPANGYKQFYRISMPIEWDGQNTMGKISEFTEQWLSVGKQPRNPQLTTISK